MSRLAYLFLCLFISSTAWAADRGAELFRLCASCHGPDGQGNRLVEAPSIAGLPAWYVSAQLEKFRGGLRGKHPDDDAGNRMRPLAMTIDPEDVKVMAAYVEALPAHKPVATLGGNPQKGKEIFNQCVACHGQNAGGNPALNAPPLNLANDWYLFRQLNNFKRHIRAYDPGDASGASMAAIAATLADERVMKDVIAYISTLDQSAVGQAQAAPASSLTLADLPKYEQGSPELVAKGKGLYSTNCAACHGPNGNGDGSGGASLNPKPRNFHAEGRSWTHGNTAASIYYTLAVGSPGTGMAGYKSLPPEDRWALVHYVMSLGDGKGRVGKKDSDGKKVAKEDISLASAPPKETLPIDFAMQRIAQ